MHQEASMIVWCDNSQHILNVMKLNSLKSPKTRDIVFNLTKHTILIRAGRSSNSFTQSMLGELSDTPGWVLVCLMVSTMLELP
jgi:hypothetical protein